jgi:hypothetical protein
MHFTKIRKKSFPILSILVLFLTRYPIFTYTFSKLILQPKAQHRTATILIKTDHY